MCSSKTSPSMKGTIYMVVRTNIGGNTIFILHPIPLGQGLFPSEEKRCCPPKKGSHRCLCHIDDAALAICSESMFSSLGIFTNLTSRF